MHLLIILHLLARFASPTNSADIRLVNPIWLLTLQKQIIQITAVLRYDNYINFLLVVHLFRHFLKLIQCLVPDYKIFNMKLVEISYPGS